MANTVNINVMRGMNLSPTPEFIPAASPARIGYTNVNLNLFPQPSITPGFATTTDPIDLVLALLMSTGNYPNGPFNFTSGPKNYDILEAGVGLGISMDQINVSSFTQTTYPQGPQGQLDYDLTQTTQQMYFQFFESEPALAFIENEICRPLGIYLRTGNDGLIHCVQPRHPKKFYIGPGNQLLPFTVALNLNGQIVSVGGGSFTATLPIGVYDANALARIVSASILAASPNFPPGYGESNQSPVSCWYSSGFFYLSELGPYVIQIPAGGSNGWTALGWNNVATAITIPSTGSIAGQVSVGQLPSVIASNTLTQNDMWGVRVLDNRDDQIGVVSYEFDYNPTYDTYGTQRIYVDPETAYLGDSLWSVDHRIRSRGLVSAASAAGAPAGSPWSMTPPPPASGPGSAPVTALPAAGADADTWTQLVAFTLIDRYKQPPIKFRASLKWKWNTLEVGDVVQVNYTVPGVFTDYELNTNVLNNRLFEITELHPNFDGSIDAVFLGHRYVSY